MRATDKPFNIDKKLVYEAYQSGQIQWRSGWCGRSDDRTVRSRLEEQSLQDLESG